MSLARGSRLGPYEVTAAIGAGGMGEVYRASDPRLDREVAIKVLPVALASDPERLARFEREARLLASLNHPNIAHVYGFESSALADGSTVHFLAMELVPGEDLAERLRRGAVPVDEALGIARQIAEGLEAAHEKGIVHRDLKPANVKLTPDGQVKVLDFGLAKAWAGDAAGGSSSDVSQSPTLARSGTSAGVILGTAAYMAPEQAAGRAVDRRADVWSFGVVACEMLTGRRLFDGETVSEVLAGVMKDAPDLSLLPPATPPRVVDLIARCLRKKPRERLQSIGEARLTLEETLADPSAGQRGPAAPAGRAPVSSRTAWVAAATALAAAAVFAVLWLKEGATPVPPRVIQASLLPPEGTTIGDTLALSPDGRRLVFEAWDQKSGSRALWLRDLERDKADKIPHTDGGEMPFWSPDGAHLAYFADGKLRRLDPRGGPPQDICDAPTPRGGAWGKDGRIVFTPAFRTGLSIVPASGGAPQVLTTLDTARLEKSHRFPIFLPDGKSFLFLVQTAEGGARNDASGIELLDLETLKRTRILATNSSPLLSAAGYLLFWRDGTLFAQRFDVASRALAGEASPVAGPVSYTQNEQVLATVSAEGTLVYRQGRRGAFTRLVWLDRKGVGQEVIQDSGTVGSDLVFTLSHDGKRLALSTHAVGQGHSDIWVHDFAAGSVGRLTFEEKSEDNPIWSADDRFIYYSSDVRNDGVIFRRRADGTGAPEELGTTDQGIWPLAASHDGRFLVVGGLGVRSNRDLLRFDLTSKELTPLVDTPSLDEDPALSPDDSLLAYASEDSGRWEVYVQAMSGERGRWQISRERGVRPRWRADGKELYFLTPPDRLMVAEVTPGAVPRFSAPRELFRFPADSFDVSPDGQRFVAATFAEAGVNTPLTVVTHWTERLTSR